MYICQNAKFLSAKKKLFLKDEVKKICLVCYLQQFVV